MSDWHKDEEHYFPRLQDEEDFRAAMLNIMNGWSRPHIDPDEMVEICRLHSSKSAAVELKKYLTREMIRDHSNKMIHSERKKGEDLFFQTHSRPVVERDEDGHLVGDFPPPFTS